MNDSPTIHLVTYSLSIQSVYSLLSSPVFRGTLEVDSGQKFEFNTLTELNFNSYESDFPPDPKFIRRKTMKKFYRVSRRAVAVFMLAVIGVLLVPAGVSLADQAFHTVRAPIYSLDPSLYPLQDGFVVVTHMNGPVNFEMKEFQLHGAKPNTQFFIYRVFQEDLRYHGTGAVIVPAGTKLNTGFSFWTDEHGDGHIITPLSPTAPSLEAIEGTVSVHIKNLLYDGPLPGGTLAYEADWYETFFDWEW